MAVAGAAFTARRDASVLLGTWLFIISDAVALAALVSTMLALGGGTTPHTGMGNPLSAGLATVLMAGLTVSLVVAGRRRGVLAAWLGLVCCLAFVGLQLVAFRALWADGLFWLEPAGERLVVVVLFHLLHVAAALVLLARALLQGRGAGGPLAIYLHYLAGMYLLIVGLFYLL